MSFVHWINGNASALVNRDVTPICPSQRGLMILVAKLLHQYASAHGLDRSAVSSNSSIWTVGGGMTLKTPVKFSKGVVEPHSFGTMWTVNNWFMKLPNFHIYYECALNRSLTSSGRGTLPLVGLGTHSHFHAALG